LIKPVPLWPHQKQAVNVLIQNRGGNLFMPMRTGKTRVAVRYIAKRRPSRVLIVAPLSALSVWRRELRAQEVDAEIMLLNFERTYSRERSGDGWMMVDNEEMMAFAPEILIVDEAHRVGDSNTLASKKLYKLVRTHRPEVVNLTGTPLERGPLRVFGMEKLIDDTLFGTSFTAFKRRYAIFGGYGGYKLLRYRNLKHLRKKMAPHTFFMEHVPSRPPVDVFIRYQLEETRELYETVSTDGFARVASGYMDCGNPLVLAVRLQQLASGAARLTVGERDRSVRVGHERVRAFEDWAHDAAESIPKLVVGCRFLFEMHDASRALQRAGYRVLLMHGGTPESHRERRIALFNDADERLAFVAQISTGKEGIDLSGADTLVFYSYSRSLVDFRQFAARIRRFRDERPLTYVYMMGEGTIDELIHMAFTQNMELIELITKHPDWVHYRRAEG
jgi:SNF2 family DNA or RNA helicase